MRTILHPVTNAVVSVAALTGLGLLLGQGLTRRATVVEHDPPVAEWPALVREGLSIGPADAPAVLVTFSDFQCPFCAQLAAVLAELRDEAPGRVRLIYRHLPLTTIHPHARDAALAAECAAEQGRFAAFHDELYRRQPEIGGVAWQAFAAAAEVQDLTAFRTCFADARYAANVDRDVALAESLDITGTPTVFLNGVQLREGLSRTALRRRIEEAGRPAS